MAGVITPQKPKVPQARQKPSFTLPPLQRIHHPPGVHSVQSSVSRCLGVSVAKYPEIAKRTQFSMQASINQYDMRYSNLPIKANQTYSSLPRGIVQNPARPNLQPR